MDAKNNPSTPSLEHQRLQPAWQLWDDLSSTETMRAAGSKYLPKDTHEKQETHAARVRGSFLYPAAHKTHTDLVAKPFSKAVTLADADELAEAIADDADRCGCDLSKFAETLYSDAIARSRSFVVVDYPNTGGAQNHGQERSGEVRPYLLHIPAQRMLSFRTERQENGDSTVTDARWRETITINNGFEEKTVERIRHLYGSTRVVNRKKSVVVEQEPRFLDRVFWWRPKKTKVDQVDEQFVEEGFGWATYEQREKDNGQEWVLIDSGPMEFAGDGLPVVQLCIDEKPPLHTLAELNVKHWQYSSDQKYNLHLQACPLLVGTGINKTYTDADGKIQPVVFEVGPNACFFTENPDAKVAFAEITGAAAEALSKAIADTRGEMEVLGLQPFLRQGSAAATATQERNDANRADSMAQQWVRATEAALLNAFRFAYAWAKREMPEGLAVNIYSDFQLDALADAHIKVLFDAHARGLLTKLDLAQEIARRGITAESYDPEESIELAEGEMQMALPMSEPPGDEDEEPDNDEGEEGAA